MLKCTVALVAITIDGTARHFHVIIGTRLPSSLKSERSTDRLLDQINRTMSYASRQSQSKAQNEANAKTLRALVKVSLPPFSSSLLRVTAHAPILTTFCSNLRTRYAPIV